MRNVAAKAIGAIDRVAAGTATSMRTGAAATTRTLTVKTERAMRQIDAGGMSEAAPRMMEAPTTTPRKLRESADTVDVEPTATTIATATTTALLGPMAQGTTMRQTSRPLAATDHRSILTQKSTLPANVPRSPQLPQMLVPQQCLLSRPNDKTPSPRLPSYLLLHLFQDLSPSVISHTLTSMELGHHIPEELQMHFPRRQQLPYLLCSLVLPRVHLKGTHLPMLLSTRMASRTPISLCVHTVETHTSLRTHSLPLLMAGLRRLAAHVARGVRTTITRSPTVSSNLLETLNSSSGHCQGSSIIRVDVRS